MITMSKIIVFLAILAVVQITLLAFNVKIDVTIVNNISWYKVFMPTYILIGTAVLAIAFLSILKIQ